MDLRARRAFALAINGTDPEFKDQNVNGKADPEGDAEELLRQEMSKARGCEEDTHDRARGGDTEKDSNGAELPAALGNGEGLRAIDVCAGEREKKQGVECQDGGALGPSADREDAHRICSETDDGAKGIEDSVNPAEAVDRAEYDPWSHEDKQQSGEDVCQCKYGVRGEDVVEGCHLGRSVIGWGSKRNETTQNDGNGDDNGDPEAYSQPEGGLCAGLDGGSEVELLGHQ